MDALDEGSLHDLRASRGVAWPLFLPFCFLVLFIAALAAGVLDQLFIRGWYIVLIVPLAAALVLAACVHLAVTYGHCRRRTVAAMLGFAAASVMYLGQYQIDLARQAGPRLLWRIDLLPQFIAFRKKIERREKVGPQARPAAGNAAQQKPDLFGNWFMFGLEFTFVLFAGTYTGYCAAGRPYCARCHRWKRRNVALFPFNLAPQIVRAVDEDRLDDFLALHPIAPPQQGSYTAVVLGWCPPRADAPACPTYLWVKAVRRGGGPTQYSQIDAVFGRTLLAQRRLSSAELVKLLPRFPALVQFAQSAEQRQRRIKEEETPPGHGAVAEVRPVASIDAGKILNQRTIVLGNALSLAPLVMLGIGPLLMLAGLSWMKGAGEPLRVAVGGTGGVILLAGGLLMRDVGWLSRKMLVGRARTAIGLRADALVRPEDHDAIFVQVVPRERWGKLMLETATDVGFVKLDARRREVHFEGDRERYRIPGDAILSCEVEKVVYGTTPEPHETCAFLSVLRARGPDGVFEAPLGQRAGLGHRTVPARRQWAEQFSRQILALAPNAAVDV